MAEEHDPYFKLDPSGAQERGERLRRAIDAWTSLQERDMAAVEWAQQHNEELQQAAGELQDAFIEAAVEWLTEKWGQRPDCPYCGNQTWSVGTGFEVSVEGGQKLSPHFTAMCDNCGNTVFINAIVAGLWPEDEDEDE